MTDQPITNRRDIDRNYADWVRKVLAVQAERRARLAAIRSARGPVSNDEVERMMQQLDPRK